MAFLQAVSPSAAGARARRLLSGGQPGNLLQGQSPRPAQCPLSGQKPHGASRGSRQQTAQQKQSQSRSAPPLLRLPRGRGAAFVKIRSSCGRAPLQGPLPLQKGLAPGRSTPCRPGRCRHGMLCPRFSRSRGGPQRSAAVAAEGRLVHALLAAVGAVHPISPLGRAVGAAAGADRAESVCDGICAAVHPVFHPGRPPAPPGQTAFHRASAPAASARFPLVPRASAQFQTLRYIIYNTILDRFLYVSGKNFSPVFSWSKGRFYPFLFYIPPFFRFFHRFAPARRRKTALSFPPAWKKSPLLLFVLPEFLPNLSCFLPKNGKSMPYFRCGDRTALWLTGGPGVAIRPEKKPLTYVRNQI